MELGRIPKKLGEIFIPGPAVPPLRRASRAEREAARKFQEERERRKNEGDDQQSSLDEAEAQNLSYEISPSAEVFAPKIGRIVFIGLRNQWSRLIAIQGPPTAGGRGLQEQYRLQMQNRKQS